LEVQGKKKVKEKADAKAKAEAKAEEAVGSLQLAVFSWQSSVFRGEAQQTVGSPQFAVGLQHLISLAIHCWIPFGQGDFRGQSPLHEIPFYTGFQG
jgi:hypothetical protein